MQARLLRRLEAAATRGGGRRLILVIAVIAIGVGAGVEAGMAGGDDDDGACEARPGLKTSCPR